MDYVSKKKLHDNIPFMTTFYFTSPLPDRYRNYFFRLQKKERLICYQAGQFFQDHSFSLLGSVTVAKIISNIIVSATFKACKRLERIIPFSLKMRRI